ncbi:SoxR reducing system RseC family protein [Anaerococcus prevotii]|uniref:Positive regulator of sigma(E), RseC/MucC n=1 Tax=Anaerococcus prevotii ACS-065-V-Col13 TaxID=879305 RepID=F0GU91_9FIRM|nr:SoxR reducing system RseC family protein [Anaerococcus prevotii]EGC82554.1 positive regulator of sigma(E), RseC/MucC [Anaerococcus prevotii ACS-065-V-Col13]
MDKVTKEGIVLDNNKGHLTVQIFRNGACGSCSASGSCAESKTTEIELFTHENIKKGDRVMIEGSSNDVTKLTAVVYIFPVVMILIGAILPNVFLKNTGIDLNLLTLISVLVFLLISLIFVKGLDSKVKDRNIMKVRKIN